jgi:NAD-dependent deacetylase
LKVGDLCEKGSQLRPNIVWFGEMVPLMATASLHARQAEIFLIVGTSLVVYPAAGLIHDVPFETPKFVVDPKLPDVGQVPYLKMIQDKASTGLETIKNELLALA